MPIAELVNTLTPEDIISLAKPQSPGIAPGQEGNEELESLGHKMPVLNHLMVATVMAHQEGYQDLALHYKTMVHLLILLYKKEQQVKIDSLLKS